MANFLLWSIEFYRPVNYPNTWQIKDMDFRFDSDTYFDIVLYG